jgi:hypothetical protein
VRRDEFDAARFEDRNVGIGMNKKNTNDSVVPSDWRRFRAVGMVVALILCLYA